MPKATLEFSLPEERIEFETAARAQDILSVLGEHDEWLRSKLKHGELTDDQRLVLEECRSHLWSLLDDSGVCNLL